MIYSSKNCDKFHFFKCVMWMENKQLYDTVEGFSIPCSICILNMAAIRTNQMWDNNFATSLTNNVYIFVFVHISNRLSSKIVQFLKAMVNGYAENKFTNVWEKNWVERRNWM